MSAISNKDDNAIHGHALTLETLKTLERWLVADSVQNPEISSEILLLHYVFEIAVERHGIQVAGSLLEATMTAMVMSVAGEAHDNFYELVGKVERALKKGRQSALTKVPQ